jgi:hypothetical protein
MAREAGASSARFGSLAFFVGHALACQASGARLLPAPAGQQLSPASLPRAFGHEAEETPPTATTEGASSARLDKLKLIPQNSDVR